ncbi:hypothetical protein MIND_00399700 [Mycena indigotica]|uniref:Uncharacterized protein n=1 Tax=Mycena indigotica TaxID=2126181 RepID=A0A8H6T237_9AGAR|nr:uncharacterized protein MIND_00399700 [Mycena indigotica]KAF7310258.1 hypothetical protein MIND_00399700 [Mycena indigotica]
MISDLRVTRLLLPRHDQLPDTISSPSTPSHGRRPCSCATLIPPITPSAAPDRSHSTSSVFFWCRCYGTELRFGTSLLLALGVRVDEAAPVMEDSQLADTHGDVEATERAISGGVSQTIASSV